MKSAMNRPFVCQKIIGRVHERAGLRELVEQAKGGRGQVVVLAGEAGIGKSRLVAETRAVAQAEGFLVLEGSCLDRKSTRLNSSHLVISYAVFCFKKKKN